MIFLVADGNLTQLWFDENKESVLNATVRSGNGLLSIFSDSLAAFVGIGGQFQRVSTAKFRIPMMVFWPDVQPSRVEIPLATFISGATPPCWV